MGEKAHIVVIDQSTEKYIHAHPHVEEGKIKAPVLFSKPGLYKIWLQFQVNGQLTIQDFVINVQQEAEKSYICPMNCEHKTYTCPGFCPVCKMELAPTK